MRLILFFKYEQGLPFVHLTFDPMKENKVKVRTIAVNEKCALLVGADQCRVERVERVRAFVIVGRRWIWVHKVKVRLKVQAFSAWAFWAVYPVVVGPV